MPYPSRLSCALRSRLPSALCAMLLLAITQSSLAASERSTVLIMTTVAGRQEATYGDDGSVAVHFEYNDRGRGPAVDSTYRIDAHGLPTQMGVAGKNYFKADISEKYSFAGGRATWENGSDDGARELSSPAFYLALNGSPEDMALLARALLQTPGHKLALLPAGEARIKQVTNLKVRGKAGAHAITLYAIEGLDLTPNYIWLDESQRQFAQYASWQTTIREGYEDTVPTIAARQEAEQNKLVTAQARALTRILKQPLAISPVRVFDPLTLQVARDQTVLIGDGHVIAVGKAGTVSVPANAETLDGRNLFLMPGMWDMHAHYSGGYEGPLDLAAGVTTVRDLGNDPDVLAALIKSIEAGDAIGPRVIRAGLIDGKGPYSGPTKMFVDSPDEARAAVDKFAADGYEQIKIYSSIKPELVPVIAKLAHDHGLRVSGHVPAFMSARQFVEAGADEIQHANFVMLSLVTDATKTDTRTPARFTLLAQKGAALDLASPAVHEWVAFLVAHHTVVDPTLSVFENRFLERPGRPGPSDISWVPRMPPSWQVLITAGTSGLPVKREEEAVYRASYQRMIEMAGMLYRSGVPIVAGTDNIAGIELVRELELYVSAGIPPAEVLRIVTRAGAEVMKRGESFGRVAPGYIADLMLVDGDPTITIADLRRVRTVVRGDRVYDSAALYRALGVKPLEE